VQGATSKSEPPPAADHQVVNAEVRASMKADRLIYAPELARWLSSVGSRRWSTRDARRFLQRSKELGLSFQLGPRGPWVATWGALFEVYPKLGARLLSHVAGDGECPVCGRDCDHAED
jgi:hypothetical protein